MRMMGADLLLENSWAHVYFDLGVEGKHLVELRQMYWQAWESRSNVREDLAMASGDPGAMESLQMEMQQIKAELYEQLAAILSPEQMAALQQWESETQNRPQ